MTGPRSGRLVGQSNTTLDEAGRGSTGPVVGLGRRKDKHIYPRPQAEEKKMSITEHVKGAQDMKKL
jgi:hypothetical protein